jgi:hypothetical protein
VEQQRQQKEHNARDDGDQPEQRKKNYNEVLKGEVEKLSRHVFQLDEEGHKGNKFTTTMEAIHDYINIEFEHAADLRPCFGETFEEVIITEPPDEPPFGSDGKRVTSNHHAFIAWRFDCERYNPNLLGAGIRSPHR